MTQEMTQEKTTPAYSPRIPPRSPQLPAATHLFALGQSVRLTGGFLRSGNVYRITAKLPPIGDTPQYRIRNDDEQFERVATQANLEPATPASGGNGEPLSKTSFGPGSAT